MWAREVIIAESSLAIWRGVERVDSVLLGD